MVNNHLNEKNLPELNEIFPIVQVDHPNLNKALFENNKDIDYRRKNISLEDKTEIGMFISALAMNAEKEINNERKVLIPDPKVVFKKNNFRLKNIYKKCLSEMKVSLKLDRLLYREKNKLVKKEMDMKKMKVQNQQDEFLNSSEKDPLQSKVFIYNTKNGQGELIEENGNAKKKKIDFISHLSEKLAFQNKDTLIQVMGYDYKDDPDYIFKKTRFTFKNLSKSKNEADKHSIVENYIDKSSKGNETLIKKIDEYIKTSKSQKNGSNSNLNLHDNNIFSIDSLDQKIRTKKKIIKITKKPLEIRNAYSKPVHKSSQSVNYKQ